MCTPSACDAIPLTEKPLWTQPGCAKTLDASMALGKISYTGLHCQGNHRVTRLRVERFSGFATTLALLQIGSTPQNDSSSPLSLNFIEYRAGQRNISRTWTSPDKAA